ncbi:hypothetical protein DRP04_09500 [Archaeoglobales archaeon]|nr:MAG: hypothetical protein DRP04_09500 [Archaeoglobales archaeon]
MKIPLKLINNPEKLNLELWYWNPWDAPWGDIEVDIMNWSTPSPMSSISISTSQSKILIGDTITISGFIYPAHTNATVTLSYKMPNGTILVRNVTSTALGGFEDTFIPEMAGSWTVRASWNGDLDHEGSTSSEVPFLVLRAKSSVMLAVSKEVIRRGDPITLSGSINPPVAGAMVTLTFEKPDGSTFNKTIFTYPNGSFIYKLIPQNVGRWSLYASWQGNENYEGSFSPSLSFIVKPKPAEFVVTDLSITPTEAEVKQPIIISVKVTNVGEQAGLYNVNLKLNGVLVGSKKVSLKEKESTVVMFQVITDNVGTFDVEVNGLKGVFMVKHTQIPWSSYAIITAVAVAAALVIITIFMKKWRASYRSGRSSV